MIADEFFEECEKPEEWAPLLERTGLAIQLASYEPDENVFLAAHGPTDSVLMSRIQGEITCWRITAGTKIEREEVTQNIRGKFQSLVG